MLLNQALPLPLPMQSALDKINLNSHDLYKVVFTLTISDEYLANKTFIGKHKFII